VKDVTGVGAAVFKTCVASKY